MPIERIDAIALIQQLLPECIKESPLLTPFPQHILFAADVFDAIREACDPPITQAEFNHIADRLEATCAN